LAASQAEIPCKERTLDSVDVARLPWAFSQQPLLTSAQFCRVARDRGLGIAGGITLDEPTPRALYRRDLVKPLLEVRARRVLDSDRLRPLLH